MDYENSNYDSSSTDVFFDSPYWAGGINTKSNSSAYKAKSKNSGLSKSAKAKINRLDKQTKAINILLIIMLSLVVAFVAFSITITLADNNISNNKIDMIENINIIEKPMRQSDTDIGKYILNSDTIFEHVKKTAEQKGELVKASLTDVQYLNQLESDNHGSFVYVAETEYELIQAYNNSRKTFKTNYDNSMIRINKAVVKEVTLDGVYVTLGVLEDNSKTQIDIKMLNSEQARQAQSLQIGDIVKVQGIVDVTDKQLLIECQRIEKLINNKYLGKYNTGSLLYELFELGNTTLINSGDIELTGEIASLVKFSNGKNGMILHVTEYSNVKVLAVASDKSINTWLGLSDRNIVDGVKVKLQGTMSLSDMDESTKQQFVVYINNCTIDLIN